MRLLEKTALLATACCLSIYGCSSGDDDGQPTGQGGKASGGSVGSGGTPSMGGTANGGRNSSGGSTASGGVGEAGQPAVTAGAGGAAEPSSAGAGGAVGGEGGASVGQAGSGSPNGGAAGETGAAGAGGTGPAPACITGAWGRYVQRRDDTVRYEPSANNEQLIADGASPLHGAVAVADGSYHGCAALSDGSVKCWQTDASNGNKDGQLGNGTTSASAALYSASAVLTAASTPLTNIVALADIAPSTQYSNATCAISRDGKLWCWGDLSYIANNGTSLHTGYAQAITLDGANALSGVLQASLTREFACVLRQGPPKSVWCWGYNASHELAQGDTTKRQYPVQVAGLSSPSKVVTAILGSGQNTACAIDAGKVKCWGYNGATGGAVGSLSTAFDVATPTLVVLQDGTTALDNVVDLKSGYSSFAALRDGAMWVWGTHFANYAANYGATNVSFIGSAGGLSNTYGPRYVTSDGAYHDAMTTLPIDCNLP